MGATYRPTDPLYRRRRLWTPPGGALWSPTARVTRAVDRLRAFLQRLLPGGSFGHPSASEPEGPRTQTHGKHQMFEFVSFELIVHDSAGGVVFRVVTWIITVIIGAVPALCENAPQGGVVSLPTPPHRFGDDCPLHPQPLPPAPPPPPPPLPSNRFATAHGHCNRCPTASNRRGSRSRDPPLQPPSPLKRRPAPPRRPPQFGPRLQVAEFDAKVETCSYDIQLKRGTGGIPSLHLCRGEVYFAVSTTTASQATLVMHLDYRTRSVTRVFSARGALLKQVGECLAVIRRRCDAGRGGGG